MGQERWLTVAEIVERLQVHEQTVRRWLREGRLGGVPFGGRTGWRVGEEDLRAFVDRRRAARWPTRGFSPSSQV